MRSTTTFWLAFLVAVLSLALWFVSEGRDHQRPTDWQRRPVLGITADEATRLTVSSQQIEVVVEKKGAEWFLAKPVRARADRAIVERLLEAIDATMVEDVVKVEQWREREVTMADYGLADPHIQIRVEAIRGGEGLALGDLTPLGKRLFAKRMGGEDVMIIDPMLLASIPTNVVMMRDSRLIRGDVMAARRIELQPTGRGFIQLARFGGRWHVQQPVSAMADEGAVSRLATALFDARVAAFAWDPSPADVLSPSDASVRSRFEGCGLSEALAVFRVAVWVSGEDLSQELIFGAPVPERPGRVYVRRAGIGSIYEVDKSLVKVLSRPLIELRNKQVYPFKTDGITGIRIEHSVDVVDMKREGERWIMREPVAWDVEPSAVARLMDTLVGLRAVDFVSVDGTKHAADGVSVDYQLTLIGSGNEVNTVSLRPSRDGTQMMTAHVNDAKQAAVVSSESVEWLIARGADPVNYRDRSMLKLEEDDIWRLSVVNQGTTQRVERVREVWRGIPSDAMVDEGTVQQICHSLRDLKAEHIIERDPERLAAYGLESPSAFLIIGLRGDAGIRKRIRFGFLAPSGGVYAMIQGQGLLFILDRQTADLLMSNLLQTGEVAAPDSDA